MEFTGERFVPGVCGDIELAHLPRYLQAGLPLAKSCWISPVAKVMARRCSRQRRAKPLVSIFPVPPSRMHASATEKARRSVKLACKNPLAQAGIAIAAWRSRSADLLKGAGRAFTPGSDSAKRLARYFLKADSCVELGPSMDASSRKLFFA